MVSFRSAAYSAHKHQSGNVTCAVQTFPQSIRDWPLVNAVGRALSDAQSIEATLTNLSQLPAMFSDSLLPLVRAVFCK